MSELRLEWLSPSELAENPKNWRRHPQAQLSALADVVSEVGWAGACLFNERTKRLIDGHARRKVALDQGTERIPVLVGDWDEATEAKILATLDPLAAMAEADSSALDALLREVSTSSESLSSMLAELADDAGLYQAPEVTEDEVPEPPEEPITKPGDLWILGRHRLLCGDSTKAEDVGRVLDGKKPFLMVTDPPYGVEYDPNWRNETADSTGHVIGATATGKVENDDRMDWTEAWMLFPGAVTYVWHAGIHAGAVAASLFGAKFDIRAQIIWSKHRMVIGRGHYHWHHEPCWYAVRKGQTAKWGGDRTQTTIWAIQHIASETGHSTQKPVECMARPIRNHGDKDDDVYDPFLGSGTTLIAAEQLGRTCYGLEISPAYCDVICQRWEKLTGGKAVRG